MRALRRLLGVQVASEAFLLRLVQLLCFAAAPAVLIVALRGLARFANTPGEVYLGVLSSSTVALLLVVLGLVLPRAEGRTHV